MMSKAYMTAKRVWRFKVNTQAARMLQYKLVWEFKCNWLINVQSESSKSKCVHIFANHAASPTRPELRNSGDHISLARRLIDNLRKQAGQFVLPDPGATSDNTLTTRTHSRKQTENTHALV